MTGTGGLVARLRRDLGTVHAYAALIGILVGAGIFRVVRDAYAVTGPSVVLGFVVLTPVILASAVAYVVFLSTPLGGVPGGEYTHVSRTFGGRGVAFVGAWLKLIGYLGALAFLAEVLVDYVFELAACLGVATDAALDVPMQIASLAFFAGVHALGVRWFGRLQVALCAVLGVSIVVLVVPGLFAIEPVHYRPFFTGGPGGFAASLPPLFFAFAGFEALAHTAGEVRDSTRRLPRVFVRGIVATAVIFATMALVLVGVLPGPQLAASDAPMAAAAAVYLPGAGASLVAIGGVAAVATSLNATMIVPGRLAIVLAEDGLLPGLLGAVHAGTGTPRVGLLASFAIAAVLVASGQVGLTLNVAFFALMLVYAVHSAALLALPRVNPGLFATVTAPLSRGAQRAAACFSLATLAALIVVVVAGDLQRLGATTLAERLATGGLTGSELVVVWGGIGALLYARRRRQPPTA